MNAVIVQQDIIRRSNHRNVRHVQQVSLPWKVRQNVMNAQTVVCRMSVQPRVRRAGQGIISLEDQKDVEDV
jgi:hypothetical protein